MHEVFGFLVILGLLALLLGLALCTEEGITGLLLAGPAALFFLGSLLGMMLCRILDILEGKPSSKEQLEQLEQEAERRRQQSIEANQQDRQQQREANARQIEQRREEAIAKHEAHLAEVRRRKQHTERGR